MPSIRCCQICRKRICSVETGLLQQHLRWSATIENNSPTNGLQCSRKTNFWCISILKYYTAITWSPALAAMYRADTIQTLHDRLQRTPRHGSWVPDRAVHSSRRWSESCGVEISIDRAFRVARHVAWNCLPTNIRTTETIKDTFVYHLLFIMLSALEV